DAESCCDKFAALAGVNPSQVLPFSTGVIGERLPVEKLISAMPALYKGLDSAAWLPAATGIMTTDTRPKMASKRIEIAGKAVSITGIAKGSGMIKPDMATMLAYVFTDIGIEQSAANALLQDAVGQSFNRITVDGDTSTNDCCMLAATGKSGVSLSELMPSDRDRYVLALNEVFSDLATGLIRDAEGATKFVTVAVCDGATSEECLQVAYTIAESPLVKTALFASDPNWGRILAAVGRAGVPDLDIGNVAIYLGDLLIAVNGGVAPAYREELGQLEMDKDEIVVTIKLGRGSTNETVWTSDLSHDYVRINADYRT
ncbi:MAG: bifunctional glutamate N-acetyltransferase/amino-acid acetyltransferase ArgJ, partial [Pseudomonadales bacterium]|nr:bifunctional glutamate N-acetyltransferase/amino-acid acetyltransferase ArgJ [Pseudomonadales bacterium]